jgi:hypothetical protein
LLWIHSRKTNKIYFWNDKLQEKTNVVGDKHVLAPFCTPQIPHISPLKQTEYFFLNNQTYALIIRILFCHKSLHDLGIFSANHQEFSTVHSAQVSFMQVSDDRFQAESGWAEKMPETCRVL